MQRRSTADPNLKTLAGKRRQVWDGRVVRTTGGLRRRDLVQNRRGKIVSRKKSIAGRRASKPLDLWRECLAEAASVNNCPFHIAAKGTAVYRYAKKRYNERMATLSTGRRSGRTTTGRRSGRTITRSTGRATGRRSTGRTTTGRRSTGRTTTGRRSTGRATGRRSTGRTTTGRRSTGRTTTGRRSTAGHEHRATSGHRSRRGATSEHTVHDGHSDCAICMESSNEPRKHCQCGHSFHARCLNRWMRSNDTCPLCRGVC